MKVFQRRHMLMCLILVVVLMELWLQRFLLGNVDAQSFELCAFSDTACTKQVKCTVYHSRCQSGDGSSSNSSIECVEQEDRATQIRAIVIHYWLNDEGCPADVPPVTQTFNTSIVEDACVSVDDGMSSLKFTDVRCSRGDCFPARAQVELRDGSKKAMQQLEIGDEIKVSSHEVYSPVIFWGHRDAHAISHNFVEVIFEKHKTLMLTANHLVYANYALMPASAIRVGMVMTDADSGMDVRVKKVHFTMRAKGLYMPHTAHGNLVVDGILVSSYSDIHRHQVAHALLLIERVCRALGASALGNVLETQTPWLFATFFVVSAQLRANAH